MKKLSLEKVSEIKNKIEQLLMGSETVNHNTMKSKRKKNNNNYNSKDNNNLQLYRKIVSQGIKNILKTINCPQNTIKTNPKLRNYYCKEFWQNNQIKSQSSINRNNHIKFNTLNSQVQLSKKKNKSPFKQITNKKQETDFQQKQHLSNESKPIFKNMFGPTIFQAKRISIKQQTISATNSKINANSDNTTVNDINKLIVFKKTDKEQNKEKQIKNQTIEIRYLINKYKQKQQQTQSSKLKQNYDNLDKRLERIKQHSIKQPLTKNDSMKYKLRYSKLSYLNKTLTYITQSVIV